MKDDLSLPLTGFVTREWVKRRYSISNSTMHKWQADGLLAKCVKIGPRAVRMRIEDLRSFEAKFLAGRPEEVEAVAPEGCDP